MIDEFCPKLLNDTIVKEQDDRFLFLVPSKPDWVVTNKNCAIALSLCNGQHTIDNIRTILDKHPNSDDAIRIIEKLHKDGFFEPAIDKLFQGTTQGTSLRSVHLNVSQHCNLKCDYCYAEERNNDVGNSLSFKEYCDLIDDLADINSHMEVAITGGEPLLNNDAIKISEYCRTKGFYTHLLTNATMINELNVKTISSSFDVIRISIDGYTPEKHDYHRGVGSYNLTTKAIKLLEEAGSQIRLAMTVTKQNIGDIELMAERYGNKLIFQPLFNAGSAKGSDLAITGDEYFYALKNAKGVEPYAQIGQGLQHLKNRGTTRCAIGDAEISIAHNGDVYPCHMLHLPEYCAGNIRVKPIVDIYKNSSVLAKTRELSIQTRENCQECPVRLLCGGSCRARAFYLTGNLDATDSFCEYEFLALTEGLIRSADFNSLDKSVSTGCECGQLCCKD